MDQESDENIKFVKDIIREYGRNIPRVLYSPDNEQREYIKLIDDIHLIDENLYIAEIDEYDRVIERYVAPKQQRILILEQAHATIFGAHLGFHKTLERVRERFFWVRLWTDTREFVLECDNCQKSKIRSTARAPLQPLKPTRPLELVTTDLTGPLPKSKRGNKYILVICDHFTKWVQLHALRTHTADKVAKCLLSYCTTFGIPDKLLTDQGTDFESMLIAELMDLFDTKKLRTSPYHPETDGLTERFNQTLKIMLTNFVNDAQNNWDELLEQLAFAYKTAEHTIHEHTPFELMYGRIPKIPIDIFYQPRTQSIEITSNENEFVEKFVNNQKVFFRKAYTAVNALRDIKVNKTKIRYDRTTRKDKYGVVD